MAAQAPGVPDEPRSTRAGGPDEPRSTRAGGPDEPRSTRAGLPGEPRSTRAGLPESARVLIVGGGICGASALYHLAHEGWTDTVLVEKAELTSGSTWGSVPPSGGD